MDFTLHALADDWKLNALADTPRSSGLTLNFPAYLTDESGNRLTDQSGNYLIGYYSDTVYPQVLHANQDDFKLRA